MQIDFIGCTSAGKSTLIKNIIQTGRDQGIDALTREEFILRRIHLDWLRGHWPRMFMLDLVALLTCLRTWRGDRARYRFVVRSLAALPIAPLQKFYLLRNVLRRLGVHEVIRRHSRPDQLILVDEGTLQIAHNLFVHPTGQQLAGPPADLAAFVALMPLPDVVVYVRQPAPILLARTRQRGHRRLVHASDVAIAAFIQQATQVFDRLSQEPALAGRLLIVDNGQTVTPAGDPDSAALALAAQIIQESITHQAPLPVPTGQASGQPMQDPARAEAFPGDAPPTPLGMESAK